MWATAADRAVGTPGNQDNDWQETQETKGDCDGKEMEVVAVVDFVLELRNRDIDDCDDACNATEEPEGAEKNLDLQQSC